MFSFFKVFTECLNLGNKYSLVGHLYTAIDSATDAQNDGDFGKVEPFTFIWYNAFDFLKSKGDR
jgi:hypothetical protein